MLTYFTSSRGEGGSGSWKYNCCPWEGSQVLCWPGMLPYLASSSQNNFTAALQPHFGCSLEVQLSAQVGVAPATVILGDDKELEQSVGLYTGVVHAHSICSHAWIVSLPHQLLQSVSVNRKGKQLREQENHKIWMRPQESKAIHSCHCQLFYHSGRVLNVSLTYFERSEFATLEMGELLSQTIVLSWPSTIN